MDNAVHEELLRTSHADFLDVDDVQFKHSDTSLPEHGQILHEVVEGLDVGEDSVSNDATDSTDDADDCQSSEDSEHDFCSFRVVGV